MATFGGNELVLGVGLGCWLLLTALGTGAGNTVAKWGKILRRRLPHNPPAASVVGPTWLAAWWLLAIIPLVQLYAVQTLRDIVFLPGVSAGPLGSTVFSATVLAPYCVLSGIVLSLAAAWLTAHGEESAASKIYYADIAGSLLGGALFAFVLAPSFDSWRILTFAGAALLATASAGALYDRRRTTCALHLATGFAIFLAGLYGDLNQRALARAHGDSATVRAHASPYHRIVEVRAHGQTTIFLDGTPAIQSHDSLVAEELAHYSLSQLPRVDSVLVIGTGPSELIREIARHGPREIVILEPDPALRALAGAWMTSVPDDVSLRLLNDDGRRFLLETSARFSVVLVAQPPPATIQLNRYYTAEFVSAARRALKPGGVLVVSLGQYSNSMSPELAALLAPLKATLAQAFPHQLLLPGSSIRFLASDSPLTASIGPTLAARGIAPSWLSPSYLDATFSGDRLAALERISTDDTEINRDLHPVLPPHLLRLWFSRFDHSEAWIAPALATAGAIAFVLTTPIARIVFAVGFAGGAIELVILIAYQALFGALFQQVGLIATLFMAGMVAGVRLFLHPKSVTSSVPNLVRVCLGLVVGCVALAAVFPWIDETAPLLARDWLGETAIGATTFALGLGVGAVFPLACQLSESSFPSGSAPLARLYSADCMGAACGSLLAGLWLLPRFGLSGTCLVSATLILIALITHRLTRRFTT